MREARFFAACGETAKNTADPMRRAVLAATSRERSITNDESRTRKP